jgi:hypothetical protein
MNSYRTGKLARLPKEVRQIVNEMLDDGATFKQIVKELDRLGYPKFSPNNIQNWKDGGYREWVIKEEHRNNIHRKNAEIMFERVSNNDTCDGTLKLASHFFFRTMCDFDHKLLSDYLNQNPGRFFDLMLAYSRFLKNQVIHNENAAVAYDRASRAFDFGMTPSRNTDAKAEEKPELTNDEDKTSENSQTNEEGEENPEITNDKGESSENSQTDSPASE